MTVQFQKSAGSYMYAFYYAIVKHGAENFVAISHKSSFSVEFRHRN